MKAQTPTEFIASMLTPEQRAEGYARVNEIVAQLKAKHERQSRQAAAQNELEFTGENKDERDYQTNAGYTVCPDSPQKPI